MDYEFSEDIDYEIAAEPEQALEINKELNMARRIVEETAANLFLTGKAGTGKTTFLRRLGETTRKRMIVLAPTGVAAINAGGMTIHSFFQFPFTPFIPGQGFTEEKSFYRFSEEKKKIIRSLDLLVIDEISMVRSDVLDAIDDILRRMKNPAKHFGGVQLLMIGDLRQLAPVVNDSEKALLGAYYPTPYFFDSIALKKAGFLTIELQTIYRQSDSRFISILNGVRDGNIEAKELKELNDRYIPGFRPDDSEGYIRLTTHNALADEINRENFDKLTTPPHTFSATIEGKFPESFYPAAREIELKAGAQVIFIKNDAGAERRFYNGMTARVTEMSEDTVTVLPIGSDTEIEVGVSKWENVSFKIDPESNQIRQTVEGNFYQIPLKLAWAITIHKSQGLTFEKAIIDASRSFASGQAYVALSRCRSLDGLVLSSPIPREVLFTDRNVNEFIEKSRETRPDRKTLDSLRGNYYRMLIGEVFDFKPLLSAFDDFKKAVDEFLVPLHYDYYQLYHDARQRIAEKIVAVGERFGSLYASKPVDADAQESNSFLSNKISSGASYFLPELNEVGKLIAATDTKVDNSKYASRIKKTLSTLSELLECKIYILTRLTTERFSPSRYLTLKNDALLHYESNGGIYTKKDSSSSKFGTKRYQSKESKTKGYSQSQSLKMLQSGMTAEKIAEERGLSVMTVSRHLAEFVKFGRITQKDVLDSEALKLLDEIKGEVSSKMELRERASASGKLTPWEIDFYSRTTEKM